MKIHFRLSDERLITPTGISLVGQLLATSNFIRIIKNDNESDAQTYVYDLTIAGCEELGPRIYPVYFVYYAITGDGFYDYANYQVEIQGELLDSTTGKTVGNQPKDWIVYTNAKVYPTVIDENTLAAANASSP